MLALRCWACFRSGFVVFFGVSSAGSISAVGSLRLSSLGSVRCGTGQGNCAEGHCLQLMLTSAMVTGGVCLAVMLVVEDARLTKDLPKAESEETLIVFIITNKTGAKKTKETNSLIAIPILVLEPDAAVVAHLGDIAIGRRLHDLVATTTRREDIVTFSSDASW